MLPLFLGHDTSFFADSRAARCSLLMTSLHEEFLLPPLAILLARCRSCFTDVGQLVHGDEVDVVPL